MTDLVQVIRDGAPVLVEAGSSVESRYEIFDAEVVTITAGRRMSVPAIFINRGFVINRGQIVQAYR